MTVEYTTDRDIKIGRGSRITDHAADREAAKTWQKIGNLGAVARCLECIAFILQDQTSDQQNDRLIEAAEWIGFSKAIRKQFQSPMNPVEPMEYKHYAEQLQVRLGPELDSALHRGQNKQLDQVLQALVDQQK